LYIIDLNAEEDDMATSTVNISFPKEFLEEIDRIAEVEARTRSELIREATRRYLTQRKRWDAIFAFGAKQAAKFGLSEKDIAAEIGTYRARKNK
jgi:CopG family transcriptional regulator/antitoxin EndoAI